MEATVPTNSITCYCGALLHYRPDMIHKVTIADCPCCGAPRHDADLPPLPHPLPYPRKCTQCGGELLAHQLRYCTQCEYRVGRPVRRFVLPRQRAPKEKQ